MTDKYFASGFGFANGWYMQNTSFKGFTGAFEYLSEKELSIIIYTTQSVEFKSEGHPFKY